MKSELLLTSVQLSCDGCEGSVLEGTDFGQSRFGHQDLNNFGQSNFGQSIFGHRAFWPGQSWPKPILANPILANPIFGVMVRPPRVGGQTQKKWGPEVVRPRRVGPRRVGAQNFALIFPSSATMFFLLSLSWGPFRGMLVVFETPGRSNVHVWSSRAVVCEPRRPR